MPKDAEGVYEPGQTLTEEEKGEILKDVARQKAEQKAVADKVKNAKTSVALGITRKAPAAGSTSKSAAASKPAGIEGMITAAKKPVLSPEEQAAAEAAEAEAAAAAAAEAQARRLEAAARADAERERRWAWPRRGRRWQELGRWQQWQWRWRWGGRRGQGQGRGPGQAQGRRRTPCSRTRRLQQAYRPPRGAGAWMRQMERHPQ